MWRFIYLIEIRSTTTLQNEIDVTHSMHESTVMDFSTVFSVRPEIITNGSFPFAIFMAPSQTGRGIVIEKSLLLTNSISPSGVRCGLSFSLSARHMLSRILVRGAFPDWPGMWEEK